MVCAAFQSSYILDYQKQIEKFSYFEGDSLILTASAGSYKKGKYGLAKPRYGYWKKQDFLVVKQKDVYSDEVDSILNAGKEDPMEMAEFDYDSAMAAKERADSLRIAGVTADGEDAWSNTERFNYNVDFVNYMMLVGNDVLKAQAAERDSANAESNEANIQPDSLANDSTSNKGGFFKGLFKGGKKKKKDKRKLKVEPTEQEEDENTTPEPQPAKTEEESEDDSGGF